MGVFEQKKSIGNFSRRPETFKLFLIPEGFHVLNPSKPFKAKAVNHHSYPRYRALPP